MSIVALAREIPRGESSFLAKRSLILLLCSCCCLGAEPRFYAGALGGVSSLSADASSIIGQSAAATSSYKPENGAVFGVFGGVHLNDFLSLQANFMRNRNDLTLAAVQSPNSAYEQLRQSSQLGGAGDVLVYFRRLRSRVRPFLSAGVGAVRFKSEVRALTQRRGSLVPPPREFRSVNPALRVAVGIDLEVGRGWSFRYSFLEAIQRNSISAQIAPPGQRNLATFQNLFGVVTSFGGHTR